MEQGTPKMSTQAPRQANRHAFRRIKKTASPSPSRTAMVGPQSKQTPPQQRRERSPQRHSFVLVTAAVARPPSPTGRPGMGQPSTVRRMTRQRGETRTACPKHQRAVRVNWPHPNPPLSGNRVVAGKYSVIHVSSASSDPIFRGKCGHGQQWRRRGQDGSAATGPSRRRRPPRPQPPRGCGRRQRPPAWRPRRRRQLPACTPPPAATATAAAAAARAPPRQWRRYPARGGGSAAAGVARGVAPDGGAPSQWPCTRARPARRRGRGSGGCGAPHPPNCAPVWRSRPLLFISCARGAPVTAWTAGARHGGRGGTACPAVAVGAWGGEGRRRDW